MKKLIPLCLLCACGNDDIRDLESWVGVYRIDAYHLDDETCSADGPEVDPPSTHLLVGMNLFDGDILVRGIRCRSEGSCGDGTHFEFFVDERTENRLTGTGIHFQFLPITSEEGACNVEVARVDMHRDGEALDLGIQRLNVRDERVASEEACLAFAEAMTDEHCAAFEEFELTRVRR